MFTAFFFRTFAFFLHAMNDIISAISILGNVKMNWERFILQLVMMVSMVMTVTIAVIVMATHHVMQ